MQDQLDFIDLVEDHIIDSVPQNIILGGDFNLCIDPKYDRAAPQHLSTAPDGNRFQTRIQTLMDSLHLFDVWRKFGPPKNSSLSEGATRLLALITGSSRNTCTTQTRHLP